MNNVVWLYWESFNNRSEPAYITLCRWTMQHNWRDHNLIFVNPGNLDLYLPGMSLKLTKFEVDVRGRLDLIRRKFFPNSRNLAVKSDIIRANLLATYGGIYADASIIALKPLDQYFENLSKNGSFLCVKRSSHNRNHYPVSFYGSCKNSKVIHKYVYKMSNILSDKSHLHYNELGADLLTPIVNEHLNEVTVLDEINLMPVPFEDADQICWSPKTVRPDLNVENLPMFKIFSHIFTGSRSKLSILEIYNSPTLLGYVFRHALPNAALPFITIIGLDIPFLLAGAVVTERIFGWPGMGRLFIDHTERSDFPMLMGILMLISIAVVIFQIITDVVYSMVDPRIRLD